VAPPRARMVNTTPLFVVSNPGPLPGLLLREARIRRTLNLGYVLANDNRREHLARPIVGASVAAACLGLVMVAAEFAGY